MPRIPSHRLAPGERLPNEPVIDSQRKSTVDEVVLERKGNRLGPEKLGLLAKRLAAVKNRVEASLIKERIIRGFYEI